MKFASIIFVILWLTSCNSSLDKPITYKIPESYSGPFVIIQHESYTKTALSTKNEYILNVPKSGILKLKNPSVLNKWHKITNQNIKSGPTSVHGNSDDNPPSIHWHYVGNTEDFKTFFYGPNEYDNMKKWLQEKGITDAMLSGKNKLP